MKEYRDKDLKNLNTLRLSSRGDLFVIESVAELQKFVKECDDFLVLGLGANLVLPAKVKKNIIKLSLGHENIKLEKPQDTYILPASFPLNKLTAHAIKHGLKGWEALTGVPATLGGAVFMNAGTGLGEICSIINKVKYVSSCGELKEHVVGRDSFSYRKNNFLKKNEVIYEVELKHLGIDKSISEKIKKYLSYRNETQPLYGNTCGCIFKNNKKTDSVCAAGKFIDILGLKGLCVGDLFISEQHGNFFINKSDASKEDIAELICKVNKQCLLNYGFEFEIEAIL